MMCKVVMQPGNDEYYLEVGMEVTNSQVPANERQNDEVQVVDVVRWWLLLVLVTYPPCAVERQKRSTELL